MKEAYRCFCLKPPSPAPWKVIYWNINSFKTFCFATPTPLGTSETLLGSAWVYLRIASLKDWILKCLLLLQIKHNFCSSVKPGSLLIDTSTIEPAVAKEMGEIVHGKGATFLDAPVSGGEVSCNPQHLNISMHVLLTALCGDHFLYFHNLHVWFRGNIVRINLC